MLIAKGLTKHTHTQSHAHTYTHITVLTARLAPDHKQTRLLPQSIQIQVQTIIVNSEIHKCVYGSLKSNLKQSCENHANKLR